MPDTHAYRHKQKPASPSGRVCPWCDKPSYSLSGIHPQCCAESADAKSKLTRKARIATTNLQPRSDFGRFR